MKNWIFVGLPIGAQRHGVELFGPHLFLDTLHKPRSPEAQKKTNGRYGFEIGRYPTNFCRSCYSNPYFLMGSMLGKSVSWFLPPNAQLIQEIHQEDQLVGTTNPSNVIHPVSSF